MLTVRVLVGKRLHDGAELFCFPDRPFDSNGEIQMSDGAVFEVSVLVALEKMGFFLYDPSKIGDPYRRAVLERIHSGEAIRDWLSGGRLKVDIDPPSVD